jgi:hypothetical protein
MRSSGEGSISLSTELSFKGRDSSLPVLGVFDFYDKNTAEGERGC